MRALLAVLDDRGKREALLIESLEKREASLCQEMSTRHLYDAGIRRMPSESPELDLVREDSSSPVSDVDNNLSLTIAMNESLTPFGAIVLEAGKKGEEQNRKWRRLQEFDMWIWKCFYLKLNAVKYSKRSYLDSLNRCESCHDLYWRDEKHCKICHTTFELDFDLEERYAIHVATCREKGDNSMFPKFKVLSSQLQSLKAAVHAIEVCCHFLIGFCFATWLFLHKTSILHFHMYIAHRDMPRFNTALLDVMVCICMSFCFYHRFFSLCVVKVHT